MRRQGYTGRESSKTNLKRGDEQTRRQEYGKGEDWNKKGKKNIKHKTIHDTTQSKTTEQERKKKKKKKGKKRKREKF